MMSYVVVLSEEQSLIVDNVMEVSLMDDGQAIFYGEDRSVLAVVNRDKYQMFYKENWLN